MKKELGGIDPSQLELSYDTLWKSIIRPPRDIYDIEQILSQRENIYSY